MVNMVFPLERRDIRPSEGATTLVAKKTKPSEVICFAKWVLSLTVLVVCREELRGHDLSTILSNKTRQFTVRARNRIALHTRHLKQSK